MPNDERSKAQDDYEGLSAQAERLGLEDEERDNFISSAMKRYGYKPRTTWDEPEPENGKGGGGGGGDFFSGKRKEKEREKREVRQGEQRRGSGADWQYGG